MFKATTRNYTFEPAVHILGDMYPVYPPVFVTFVDGLKKDKETVVKGGYGHIQGKTETRGIIYLNGNLEWREAVTVMIHEYAHHLSQQNHGFVMYELWKEWLREEFVRRYNDYVRGETDQGYDRGRTVVVGEVCDHGTCESLQE
jgi:hypothetical protein